MLLPKFPLPYYAVIFASVRTEVEDDYIETNAELEKMAEDIEGFLGTESTRGERNGLGLSVSYWKNLEAIEAWRKHTHHAMAKKKGIEDWYKTYSIRIAKVEHNTLFEK